MQLALGAEELENIDVSWKRVQSADYWTCIANVWGQGVGGGSGYVCVGGVQLNSMAAVCSLSNAERHIILEDQISPADLRL